MPAQQPSLTTGVVDRVLALVGDALVIGIVLLAVQLGALDRTAAIVTIGWALRSIVSPTTTLSTVAGAFGLPLASLLRPPGADGAPPPAQPTGG